MTTVRHTLALALALSPSLVACGGTAAKYTVDDVALAQIPTAEKQPIFDAEKGVSVAKSDQIKVQSDRDAVQHDMDVASAERDQAKLETVKAKLGSDEADKSHDQNRLGAAQRDLKIAELGERAADAKLDWLQTLKKWHDAKVDTAEAAVAVANAKVELAKADLAVAKGIKPAKDFSIEPFKADVAKREKQWQESKSKEAERKANADKDQKTFNDLEAQAAQLKAPPSTPPPSAR